MKLLYICTHNRCRSILSEAITRRRAAEVIDARSAGSQPAGEVHPLTLKFLSAAGYPIDELCSQSWDDFEAWSPDVVVTVCDRAAGEPCPLYFGCALKVHWGLADPSALAGSDELVADAFAATIREIERRVDTLQVIATRPRDDWQSLLTAASQLKSSA